MKHKTKNTVLILLGILFSVMLGAAGIFAFFLPKALSVAHGESANFAESDFIVTEYEDATPAEYSFTRLNESDCSVRLENKATATKAVIPSKAEIDGVEYNVTEIASSGFMSSSKLVRVSLPGTVKRIGSNAFANCPMLQRVSLANVEEIGNTAFYKCPSLADIVIPQSATKVGTYVFRNNNTLVRARQAEKPTGWASAWNTGNANANVEFGSKYVQPLELEVAQSGSARSGIVSGYVLASGQPRTEAFYARSASAIAEGEQSDGNIYIPAQVDNAPVLAIDDFAFEMNQFDQLIVEYSERALMLGSDLFMLAEGNNIVINRPIEFYSLTNNQISANTFSTCTVKNIVLPDSLTQLSDCMFLDCGNLTNVFFRAPDSSATRSDLVNLLSDPLQFDANYQEGVVVLPQSEQFTVTGESAFSGTVAIKELHMYDNLKTVKSNLIFAWEAGQTVYVHNKAALPQWNWEYNVGWHIDWSVGSACDIVFDNEYYTITFNANGGLVSPAKADVLFGQPVGELPVPLHSTYVFEGWYTQDGVRYTAETVYNVKKNITLTAKWKTENTVTFHMNGGYGGTEQVTAEIGKPMPAAVKPQRTGYNFEGYFYISNTQNKMYYDREMNSVCNWDKSDDVTLIAKWKNKKYDVTLKLQNESERDIITVAEYDKPLDCLIKNTSEKIEIPVLQYYDFIGFFTQPEGEGTQYIDENMQGIKDWDIDSDITVLYAAYRLHNYKITYIIENGEQSSYGHPLTYNLESENFTLNVIRENGQMLVWNKSGLNVEEEIATGDITFIGTWQENVTKIIYNYAGTHSNPKEIRYSEVLNLTDAVRKYYNFQGWYLNGQKVTTLTHRMEASITLTAKWKDRVSSKHIQIPSNQSTFSINLSEATLIAPASVNGSLTLEVGSNVKKLHLYSRGVAGKMQIYIKSRNTDLDLYLEDITIKAYVNSYTACAAIYMEGNCKLNLHTYGNVKIIGADATQRGAAGFDAIKCTNVQIYEADNLIIQGGNGADTSMSAFGGLGGIAFDVSGTITIGCNNVSLLGGLGGRGSMNIPAGSKNNEFPNLVLLNGVTVTYK